jgi:hypothetical protein
MAYNHLLRLYYDWLSAETPVDRYNAMVKLLDFQHRKMHS